MTTVDCSQYAMTATLPLDRVNQWRDTRLEVLYNQWRDRFFRKVFQRWAVHTITRLLEPYLPSYDENSSADSSGPPSFASSSDDEQIPLPAVATDSETDNDSDSDTVVMPVRNPDGSVELRQLPIALVQQAWLRGRSVNFI